MEENRINGLTEEEQQEYIRLRNIEAMGKRMGKELPENQKQRLEELKGRLGETLLGIDNDQKLADKERLEDVREIPEELKTYREAWKQGISSFELEENILKKEIKEKIIEAADKIPVKIEIDSDGSRLIEFKLGKKTYKILDPRLENHTDDKYRYHQKKHTIFSIVEIDKDYVTLKGMMGDNVDKWKNKKLKEYVKEKQREGLHIPDRKEIEDMLQELGDYIGLLQYRNQIAMLMYLTGMDADYWLSMKDGISRDKLKWLSMNDGSSRNMLNCGKEYRYICPKEKKDRYPHASLCMIACENS